MMIPDYATINEWSSSLLVDFANDNLPILTDNKDWKSWGNYVIQADSFSSNACPGTDMYDNWKDWAGEVYFCMTNDL
jgi:hypothetical protein